MVEAFKCVKSSSNSKMLLNQWCISNNPTMSHNQLLDMFTCNRWHYCISTFVFIVKWVQLSQCVSAWVYLFKNHLSSLLKQSVKDGGLFEGRNVADSLEQTVLKQISPGHIPAGLHRSPFEPDTLPSSLLSDVFLSSGFTSYKCIFVHLYCCRKTFSGCQTYAEELLSRNSNNAV